MDDKLIQITDSRDRLDKLFKAALGAKSFADFDATSTKTFLAVKEVEKVTKELPHLVAGLQTEVAGLNKLVADKGKSLTYRAQLAASKSKAAAFKYVVQFTKEAATFSDHADKIAAALAKEDLGERYYDARNRLKGADAKKFPGELSKHIKGLSDLLHATAAKAAGGTVTSDAKRLSADPDLDDEDE